MADDSKPHHRRSIRLHGYDYARDGAYFITICTKRRSCIFGEVGDDAVRLSRRGLIVDACWHDIPNHHSHAELDQFVIMPNHLHGIVWIVGSDVGRRATQASPLRSDGAPIDRARASTRPHGPSSDSLGAIIGSFKSAVSRKINRLRPGAATGMWQPNYYEHIIRDEDALIEIRKYILANPQRWLDDGENPAGTGRDRFDEFVRSLDLLSVEREKMRCAAVAFASSQGYRREGDAGVAPTVKMDRCAPSERSDGKYA